MGTYSKNTAAVDNSTDTQLIGRSVHEAIRDQAPMDCFLTKLTKISKVNKKTGAVTFENGLINAVQKPHSRVECFTHLPKTNVQTCGAGSSALDAVLANTTLQINTRMVFQNSANLTVGMIDSISGTTCTFVTLGSTTFSCSENDVLVYIGTMYEYGSSDPTSVTNTDDNNYNVMGIFRHAIETTLSAKDSKQLAGGNRFERYKKYEYTHHIRAVERNFIFGQRASSGNTTSMSTLDIAVPSARGLWDMAQSDYTFGGSMTFEKIQTNLFLAMHESMDSNGSYMWAMGKNARARIFNLMQDNSLNIRSNNNKYEKWGIECDTIKTGGPDLDIVVHNAFNLGANTGRGIILDPKTLEYNFKNGNPPLGNGKSAMGGKTRNWNIIQDIQSNSSDTKKDEVFNESCFLSLNGGYDIVTTRNMI